MADSSQVQVLANAVSQLQDQATSLNASIQKKIQRIQQKELRLKNQMLNPTSLESFETRAAGNLPSWLAPGNVGDLNKVVWPFLFVSTQAAPLIPNGNITTQISVTQEACFVFTHFTKSVYSFDSVTNAVQYIDPNTNDDTGLADGLQFSIRDAQSTREFFDGPADLDFFGNPRFPTKLPAPQMV